MSEFETAFRRALTEPRFYLPFVGHWIVLLPVAAVVRKRPVQKFVAWWVFVTLITWSLGVRRILAAI